MLDTVQLLSTGASQRRVDIALVAEGYTAAERATFIQDATAFTTYLFNQSNLAVNDPFYAYRGAFNVSATFVASQDSGYSKPGVQVNTAFGAAASPSAARLIFGDSNKVLTTLQPLQDASRADMVIVLVNSADYGGAGGAVAWATGRNPASYEVAVHEVGHSFARLQDEYVDAGVVNNYPLSLLANSVHVATTNDPNLVPWKRWLGFQDALGTVGTFEGGFYRDTGVWRATQTSKMRDLGQPFNAPEKEAFVSRFYDFLDGQLELTPTTLVDLTATVFDPATQRLSWTINGQAAAGNVGQVSLLDRIKGSADGALTFAVQTTSADALNYVRDPAITQKATQQQTVNVALTKQTFGDGADNLAPTDQKGWFMLLQGGDDRVSFAGNGAAPTYVEAGTGRDNLTGSAGADIFWGGADDDQLAGMRGADRLFGEAGRDSLFGDQGLALPADGGQVFRLYQATFGRQPDVPGYQGWVQQLKNGRPLTEVAGGFTGSQEFQNVYAGSDNAAFVTKLYANVLNRAPDQPGLDSWLAQLNGGTTRTQVVLGFSESAEFQTNTAFPGAAFLSSKIVPEAGGQAFRLYQATLGRAPDQGGFEGWTTQLAQGRALLEVAGGFTGSQEFQTVYGPLDSTAFVTLLYRNVLNRTPDQPGLQGWVSQLNGGTQRTQVVLGFSESAEFRTNTAAAFANFVKTDMASLWSDQLNGGVDADLIFGGLGADTIVFGPTSGTDRVIGLDVLDRLDLRGFGYQNRDQAIAEMRQNGADVVLDKGNNDVITFANMTLADMARLDYLLT